MDRDRDTDRYGVEKGGQEGTPTGFSPTPVSGYEEEDGSLKGIGMTISTPYNSHEARVTHMKVTVTPMYSKIPIGRKVR